MHILSLVLYEQKSRMVSTEIAWSFTIVPNA